MQRILPKHLNLNDSNEKYRETFYKTFTIDEIKTKIINQLDTKFFELFINVSNSKLELVNIVNLLEEKINQLKYLMKNNKNKNLFIIYTFINLSISSILILLTKILLIDNDYSIKYTAHLRGFDIEEIHFKFFKCLGLIIVMSIIIIAIITMYKISHLYPINYVLNSKIKKIKEIILKIEDKINSESV